MKKFKLIILLFLSFILISCSDDSYIIHFNTNGGTAIESIRVDDPENFVLTYEPVKEGYKFIGWYLDSNFINEFISLEFLEENVNIYAKWEKLSYTINYELDGGTCDNLITSFSFGDEVSLPIPLKEGHAFLGWYELNSNLDELDKVDLVENRDYNLIAKWDQNKFNYQFLNFDDSIILEGTCNYGDSITPPQNPVRDKDNEFIYEFTGWDKEYNNITENTIFKPIYNKIPRNTYFIQFYVDEVLIAEKEVEKGSVFEEFIPIKEEDNLYSYEFVAWEENIGEEDFFEFNSIINEDKKLYAVFEEHKLRQSFKVNFYDERKIKITTKVVKRGECVQEYNYIKENSNRYTYEFDGWYNRDYSIKYDFNTKVYDDYDLYVKFNKIALPKSQFELEGKRISILGDSISTFYDSSSDVNSYYGGNNEFYYPIYSSTVKNVELTWWHKLITKTNMVLGINNSLSGSSINSSDIPSRISTLGKNGKPDIIIIFLGTNDNVNGYHSQFESAYRVAIDNITRLYPDAYIFACKLGYSKFNKYYYTEEMRLNYNSIIDKLALEYDMGVVELDKYQTLESYSYLLGDTLHPNANGMEEYCTAVIEAFKKYFK